MALTAPASPRLRWLTVALLLAGAVLSLLLPFVSATFLTILLGSTAVVAAISQFLRLNGEPDTKGKVFRALSGVLYVVGGVSCLVFPIESTLSLTLLVGCLLAVEGVMELAAAATQSLPARGLVLMDGIITAVLGGMLIAQWPTDSLWAIGTLFGLSLVFSAINLLIAPAETTPV
jgi:uncharacterized membrane protein HdeD (DUF308 family)